MGACKDAILHNLYTVAHLACELGMQLNRSKMRYLIETRKLRNHYSMKLRA